MTKKLSLWLDMDGVFSDFREGLSRMCKIEFPEERMPEHEFKQFQEFCGYKVWSRPFFWNELKPLPGALELYEHFRPHNPNILTAVMRAFPLNSVEAVTCGEEKRVWVREQFGVEQSKDGRFNWTKADLKHTYCKAKENPDTVFVLVDDHKSNIIDWGNAGGIGILHENNEKTLLEFERVLSQL